MRRAYSYKRFSSPKQARGDSIRRQTEFERQVVAEMGLVLDDTLDLSDTGVSAFHGKNSKFGTLSEFLKLVESGRIPPGSVLLVENIDRLSRQNVLDAFNLFSRVICAGITLVTAEPREVYDHEAVTTNVAKLMIPLVYMMRAHDESARKSTLVHKAWDGRRKRAAEDGQPLTERCPAWLRVRGGRYEAIAERVEVIREIYRMAREGLGGQRILAHLVEAKVKPFGPKGAWHRTYVRKLLSWPAVYGAMQPHLFVGGKKVKHGDLVPGYYPPAVGKDEYDLTRAILRDRKGKDGRPAAGEGNLFTGLVWHAVDRCKMSVKTHNGPNKQTRYLRSSMVDRGKPGRQARQFPYEKLEEAVLGALHELRPEDVSDRFRDQKNGLEAEVSRLEAEVLVLNDRRKEAEGRFRDPTNTLPAAMLMDLLAKLTGDWQRASEKLARVQAEATNCRAESLGEVRSLVEMMRSAPAGAERNKLRRKIKTRLRWLLSEVWVHVEKVNHSRAYAHVQLFLRNGAKKDLVVSSFLPRDDRNDVPPRRSYHAVDFRTYTPTGAEAEVGKGRLSDVLKRRGK